MATINYEDARTLINQTVDALRADHAKVHELADFDTRVEKLHRFQECGDVRDRLLSELSRLLST